MDLRTGELITAPQAQNGAFIWEIPNPLYFKILNHNSKPFNMNHDIIDVQIRFNYNLIKSTFYFMIFSYRRDTHKNYIQYMMHCIYYRTNRNNYLIIEILHDLCPKGFEETPSRRMFSSPDPEVEKTLVHPFNIY
ncbi:replication enhancer protein [East African cassava mosaic virus]|uniref:Replication enhancer n=1 Tax=East African cassava mosaic virus TaxID=62079 RepID=U3LZP4_9GEMI|nr:replication enhancer protein [East African cassava mosaic virus]